MQNKMQRFLSVIAFLLLLSSVPVSSVKADPIQSEENMLVQDSEKIKDISVAPMLTDLEVLQIAQKHIQGYMANDIQTKDRIIEASTNMIPLYNLDDQIIAYAVPLVEGQREIGYISVGALRDGYDAYDIFIDDSVVQRLHQSISRPSIMEKSEERKIVFVPPMNYMVQVTDKGNKQYFEMDNNFQSLRDITEAVEVNMDELHQKYETIQSEENQDYMNQILQNYISTRATAAVAKEEVSLTVEANQSMFVPVQDGSGYSYGGNQNWYSQNTHKERGCGPVAAANITNYLAKITNPTVYGNLYSGNTTSKQDFLAHMDKMYDYVSPGILGKISVSGFASAVESYAKDKKVNLSRVTDNSAFTLDNTAAYIKAGLNLNSPVATLNLSKFDDYEYEWHWMTITKYYRDTTDSRWIAVSTWGQRRSINYRTHFDAITGNRTLGGGFMYFK
ncbi:C39 family peptidase [Paenibacillus taichungensis]|nr:C39 family peptidase [Paenibacillus taichungensis]